MGKLVSVIIPVYNTGKNACELISRLLSGGYDEVEIIAVDDGSSDDSLLLLRKLARSKEVRGRVKVITQKNMGASSARNAGINISRGEYLMFVDSDDEVAPDFVEKMVRGVEKKANSPMAVCGIRYKRLAEGSVRDVYISELRKRGNREKLSDYVLYLLARDGRMYSSVNKIYRASVVRENDLKFETGRDFAEDTKFVLDYLRACWASKKYSSGDIIFVREPLYIYNYGTETSTVRKSATLWENWDRQMKDTAKFAEETGGVRFRTVVLLILLGVRWRISWRRAKRRARKVGAVSGDAGHAEKFVAVGLAVTVFDFVVCTIFTRLIFRSNDYQEISAVIATVLATIVAYFAHSKITWKERNPGRSGIIKFFLFNLFAAVVTKPGLTWFFGLFTGLYELAASMLAWTVLDYATVEYLGVYALATAVNMVINFFFYDRLVFGKKK